MGVLGWMAIGVVVWIAVSIPIAVTIGRAIAHAEALADPDHADPDEMSPSWAGALVDH